MAFEQDVVNAYQKWRTEQVKIPLTAENREFKKKLFTGMGKLRGELIKFAKVFDKEIVNAEEVTSDKAKEMRDIMFKDFLNKIAELRNFIDLEDMYADASKKYGSAKCSEFKKYAITPLGSIEQSMAKLKKEATWRGLGMASFPYIKRLFGKTRFLKSPETDELFHGKDVLLEQVYDFFHSIFKSMSKISLELLKKIKIEEYKIEASDIKDDELENLPEDVKIFPTDKSPSPHEVQQAGIGDCYLQSTLMALAKNNQKAITDCFVQGIKDIDKHDKITIRFYEYDEQKGGYKQVKINVDKRQVFMREKIKNRALWPKLIELAFCVYSMAVKNRENIDGGAEKTIFEMILGPGAKRYSTGNFADEKKMLKTLEYIKSKLRRGKALSCCFSNCFSKKDVINGRENSFNSVDTYNIKDLIKKGDPGNTTNKDYIVLSSKHSKDVFSLDFFYFYLNYSKINEKFTRFESGLVNIPKIISELKGGKKVFCRFKNGFKAVDIRNHFTESFSTYDPYVIKEVHDKGKSNFVILNNGYRDFAMDINDFLHNCKKIRYEKLPPKAEKKSDTGKEPEVISKIRSNLKKGKLITCKFIKTHFVTQDIVEKKIKHVYSLHLYQITGLKEKNDPNNRMGKGYVVLVNSSAKSKDEEDDVIAMDIEDFCNHYSKIYYETPVKPQPNAEKKSDTDKEPKVISKIRSELNKGKSITCAFLRNFTVKDTKYNAEIVEIHGQHAYAIVGINDEKRYIRLIEPNKSWGRKAENSPKSKEGGHIAMSFNDFADNCMEITYGKA